MPPKKKTKKADLEVDEEAEYEFKINLIELVQMYPEIYDIQCPGHKKTYIRNAAWKKVVEALHAPGRSRYNLKVQTVENLKNFINNECLSETVHVCILV